MTSKLNAKQRETCLDEKRNHHVIRGSSLEKPVWKDFHQKVLLTHFQMSHEIISITIYQIAIAMRQLRNKLIFLGFFFCPKHETVNFT